MAEEGESRLEQAGAAATESVSNAAAEGVAELDQQASSSVSEIDSAASNAQDQIQSAGQDATSSVEQALSVDSDEVRAGAQRHPARVEATDGDVRPRDRVGPFPVGRRQLVPAGAVVEQ